MEPRSFSLFGPLFFHIYKYDPISNFQSDIMNSQPNSSQTVHHLRETTTLLPQKENILSLIKEIPLLEIKWKH